jgi:hypothetical protein
MGYYGRQWNDPTGGPLLGRGTSPTDSQLTTFKLNDRLPDLALLQSFGHICEGPR